MMNFLLKKQYVIISLLIPLNLMIASCNTTEKAYHQYIMRGSILEVDNDDVYLCIGSKHGAQVDQVLSVYHYQKNIEHPGSKGTRWSWEKTGKIKITKVVDEHFAWAEVISGYVEKGDIAELE